MAQQGVYRNRSLVQHYYLRKRGVALFDITDTTLAASAACAVTAIGDLTTAIQLAASVSCAVTVTGALTTAIALAASVTGSVTAQASLSGGHTAGSSASSRRRRMRYSDW